MTFAFKGAGGSVGSATNNQSSLSLTTATTAGAIDDLAVIIVAVDNNQTTDGDEGAVSSITVGGQTFTKLVEFTNGQGAASGGATVHIAMLVLTSAIAIGSTVTISFTNATSRDASAASLSYFTRDASKNVQLAATPTTLANDAATTPGSLNCTTPNIACLRIRATATEWGTTTNWTKTSAFTAALASNGDGTASSSGMSIRGEYLISTSTGQASAPTITLSSSNHASAYIALQEALVPSGLIPNSIVNSSPFIGTPRTNLVAAGIVNSSPIVGGSQTQATAYLPEIPLNNNNNDSNAAVRMVLKLDADSAGAQQLRFQFTPNSSLSQDSDQTHVSIGHSPTGSGPNTDATPIEIKFGGVSGISLTSGSAPIWSDWTDISSLNLVASDTVVLIYDNGPLGGYRTSGPDGITTSEFWIGTPPTWDQATVTGFSDAGTYVSGVSEIQVMSGSAGPSLTVGAGGGGLSPQNLVNTSPVIQSPSLNTAYQFSTAALVNTSPSIGTPKIFYNIIFQTLINASPVIPNLKVIYNFATFTLVNSSPTIGTVTAKIIYTPSIGVLTNSSPVIPNIKITYNLISNGVTNSSPFVGAPDYSPKSLRVAGINNSAPIIPTPALTMAGAPINFVTQPLVNSPPFIGKPDYSPKSLSVQTLINTAPAINSPTLKLIYNLSTANLINAAPVIPNPAMTFRLTITVPQGNLILSEFGPGLSGAANIAPASRNLALSSTAPTVVRTDHHWFIPASQNLTLSSTPPTILATDNHFASPPSANLSLSTLPAGLVPGTFIFPDHTDLKLTGSAPVLTSVRLRHWRRSTALNGSFDKPILQGSIKLPYQLSGNLDNKQNIGAD